jgi:hypothetical protein
VIAKQELLQNAETLQPMDQLHVEMHSLLNAELILHVTKLNLKDVQRIVMIMLIVPWILVILQEESVLMFQTTTDVLITTHVLLTDVLLKDASTLLKIALIMMHVPRMFVIQELDNVFIPQSFANLLTAKLENVILNLDAKPLKETVMMELHVPLILAVKIVDATILQMINFVMIMIHALLIDVTSKKDVFIPRLLVTTTMHVPTMFA